jgi:hypothetical protein
MHRIAIAFVACLSGTEPAFAETCPNQPSDIRVVAQITPPVFDFSRTDPELTRLKYGDPRPADYRNHRIVGLTAARIAATTHVWITSAPAGSDRLCAWPSSVVVTISTAPTIYVSPVHGRCNQDATKAHEMRHVAIDRSVIEHYLPIFRSEIARAVTTIGTIGPIPRAQLPDTQQVIHDRVRAAARHTLAALNAERSVEQQALDSAAEYERLRRACPSKSKR